MGRLIDGIFNVFEALDGIASRDLRALLKAAWLLAVLATVGVALVGVFLLIVMVVQLTGGWIVVPVILLTAYLAFRFDLDIL